MSLTPASRRTSSPSPGTDPREVPTEQRIQPQSDVGDVTYKHSLKMFQAHAKHQYRLLAGKLDELSTRELARFGWLQLAAVINPAAAFDIDLVAEAAESVQIDHSRPGHSDGERSENPLSYLVDYQFWTPRCWTARLERWEREVQEKHTASEYQTYELQAQTLRRANDDLRAQLVHLKRHMGKEYFHDDHDVKEVYANPVAAVRAAQRLHAELIAIETGLENFVERLKSDALLLEEPQNYSHALDTPISEVRRRRKGRPDGSDDEEPRSRDRSNPGGEQSQQYGGGTTAATDSLWMLWLPEGLSALLHYTYPSQSGDLFSAVQSTFRNPNRLIRPSQNTLMVISLLVSLLSGISMGVGLMQDRPLECIPNQQTRDDQFYTLISQLLLQWLSLYCLMIPLVRDKAVELRKWRFGMALAGSAAAAIVAPATYGSSWKVSMVASFVSAFASLLASAQLVGGVQEHQRGLNLNH